MQIIVLDDLEVEVEFKNIKRLYIKIDKRTGRIRVSAPAYTDFETLKKIISKKSEWIKKHLSEENNPLQRESNYINDGKKFFLGKKYDLELVKTKCKRKIELGDNKILVFTKSESKKEIAEDFFNQWYRKELLKYGQELIEKWKTIINVNVKELRIKKMKTRWGSCNPRAKRIWLSLDLIKHPLPHIEFIVVHELIHILERNHSKKFYFYMDQFLPNWKEIKQEMKEHHKKYD